MASVQASVPDNKNFLSPIGFQFTIKRLPKVNYFCTAASIPDVSLRTIETWQTPFIQLPQPGDKLDFAPLTLTFRVDEDMLNYQEIYNWMTGLGYPDNFDQRRAYGKKVPSGEIFSDASLIITTNQYKPNIEVKFTDIYPASLTALEFNITAEDVQYMEAQVTFQYRKYDLNTAL